MPTFRRPRSVMLWCLLLSTVACQSAAPADTTTTSTTEPETTTTSTTVAETTTTTTAPEPFVYRIGLSSPFTTDNYWAFYDPQSSLVDQYLLAPTKPSLYAHLQPGLELVADLAAADDVPEPVEEEDGTWTVTVPIRADAAWSDGEPITSADVVFTFETVRDLGLGRGWGAAYPVVAEDAERLGLVGVEAIYPTVVRFRFSGRPGLPLWPHGPGTAPIMARHHWAEVVAAALEEDDPEAALLQAPGAGDPSGGPLVVEEFSETAAVAAVNADYHRRGEEVSSGGIDYEIGPFLDRATFTVFPDQNAALAALSDDEVDVLLGPSGLDRQGARYASSLPDVTTVSNGTSSFRYLAFNLRRTPMSSPAFRTAVDLMVDRRLVVDQMLQAEAFALTTTIGPANPVWWDAEAAERLEADTADLTTEQRLARAVETLEAGGFEWERRPAFEDNVVVPGMGVTLEGEPVRPLEILAPGPAFDPQRATYALWIEEWIEQLGFEVDVVMSDFDGLVQQVFTPVEGGEDLGFDMYVMGWRLSTPGMPVYHSSFWGSANDTLRNGGNNNTGYASEDFDALVRRYDAATTLEEARGILWEMETVLAADKPYLILFDTGITEAYRADRVRFPFTRILGGLQVLSGMPELVRPVR